MQIWIPLEFRGAIFIYPVMEEGGMKTLYSIAALVFNLDK